MTSHNNVKKYSHRVVNNRIMPNSSEEDIKACHVKAHEVRALASSWSLFNNGSISDILNAGFRRSNDTFTSFYLRSMSNSAGNLYYLGPMVASQRVDCLVTSGSSAILHILSQIYYGNVFIAIKFPIFSIKFVFFFKYLP